MSTESALWSLEEKFWTGGVDVYERELASECLMILPEPTGILVHPQILESLRNAPRWSSVQMLDRRVMSLSNDSVALIYRAEARRQSGAYRALVGSVYRKEGGGWKLALHQQTPSGTLAG